MNIYLLKNIITYFVCSDCVFFHSSIVTHAMITADAKYVVSAESGNVLVWDVETEKVLVSHAQKDVTQLILMDDDTKVVAVSKEGPTRGKVVSRSVPEVGTIA